MTEFDHFMEDDLILIQLKEAGLFCTIDLSEANIQDEIIQEINQDTAIKFRVIPFGLENDTLQIATDIDSTFKNQSILKEGIGERKVQLYLAETENIKQALRKYYKNDDYNKLNLRTFTSERDESPLKQKFNDMLQSAVQKDASDIHILPTSKGVYIWFRVYGHMIDYSDEYNIAAGDGIYLINIIKGMDTSRNADATQTNMPNRGSFMIRRGDTIIDCRISTVPVGAGSDGRQKANIRLMPQKNDLIKMEKLYEGKDLKDIQTILQKSATGLILISGPVGSGKSTSLYAQINYLWDQAGEPLNVYCIENPIEIKDERFVQVQVREALEETLSLTAPKILKTALRSDPDIILYGEIRDAEDAKVAVTASQTGHLVFSTVHASDCIRTISRLMDLVMDLDIAKMSLISEIRMILSQRLIAKLCPYCSKPHSLTDDEKSILSKAEIKLLTSPHIQLRERGTACPNCIGGIIGRTAVAEYILFDDDLRDALLRLHSFREIQDVLQRRGYRTMWEKGMELVMQGSVELNEIINVIGKV